MPHTHSDLCDLAVKWLKRPPSAGGHGCHIAASELKSGFNGEIPDAIGFRATNCIDDGSIVVEVKTSRNDFFADKNKNHRNGRTVGMGKWRYYLTPTDLISVDELPPKFGLIYVNQRGQISLVKCPFITTNQAERKSALTNMAFLEHDVERERFLMIRLLSRVGDVESYNKKLKELYNKNSTLEKQYHALKQRFDDLADRERKQHRLLNFYEKQRVNS